MDLLSKAMANKPQTVGGWLRLGYGVLALMATAFALFAQFDMLQPGRSVPVGAAVGLVAIIVGAPLHGMLVSAVLWIWGPRRFGRWSMLLTIGSAAICFWMISNPHRVRRDGTDRDPSRERRLALARASDWSGLVRAVHRGRLPRLDRQMIGEFCLMSSEPAPLSVLLDDTLWREPCRNDPDCLRTAAACSAEWTRALIEQRIDRNDMGFRREVSLYGAARDTDVARVLLEAGVVLERDGIPATSNTWKDVRDFLIDAGAPTRE